MESQGFKMRPAPEARLSWPKRPWRRRKKLSAIIAFSARMAFRVRLRIFKYIIGELDSAHADIFNKGGDKTRRFKITQSLTLGIYAALLKDEYVFEFYMQFIQHSGNLANLNNFSRAVGKTSGLHNNINGRGNHFPDCPDRKLGAGHQNHGVQPGKDIAGRVGVDSGH